MQAPFNIDTRNFGGCMAPLFLAPAEGLGGPLDHLVGGLWPTSSSPSKKDSPPTSSPTEASQWNDFILQNPKSNHFWPFGSSPSQCPQQIVGKFVNTFSNAHISVPVELQIKVFQMSIKYLIKYGGHNKLSWSNIELKTYIFDSHTGLFYFFCSFWTVSIKNVICLYAQMI